MNAFGEDGHAEVNESLFRCRGLDLHFIAAGYTPVFAEMILNDDAMKTCTATSEMVSERLQQALSHRIVMGDIRESSVVFQRGLVQT